MCQCLFNIFLYAMVKKWYMYPMMGSLVVACSGYVHPYEWTRDHPPMYTHDYIWGFPWSWGYPQMVGLWGKILSKWMMTGGTSMTQETLICWFHQKNCQSRNCLLGEGGKKNTNPMVSICRFKHVAMAHMYEYKCLAPPTKESLSGKSNPN